MELYPNSLSLVITEFSKFPGIGRKTAERLAFHLLTTSKEDISLLGNSILRLQEKSLFCKICFNISEHDICNICINPNRLQSLICVVETFRDVISIEKTMEYKGLYHVLTGHLSPIDGIGPDKLKIKELLERINKHKDDIEEVILATNPNTEGDATSLYIARLLKRYENIKVSWIAKGLPIGADIEYADPITLLKSIMKRETIN